MPADLEQLGALVVIPPKAGEPRGTAPDDRRRNRDRFHVVDRGWAAIEACPRRERRLEARLSAVTLERLEQCGFLATDVGACTTVDDNIDVDALAVHVLTEVTRGVGLVDLGKVAEVGHVDGAANCVGEARTGVLREGAEMALGIEQTRTRDWVVTKVAVRTQRRLGRRGPVHVVDWQHVQGLTPSALAMPGQGVAQLLHQFEDQRPIEVADAIRDHTRGLGVDVALEASGAPSARRQAVQSVRPWGKVCLVGEGGGIELDVSSEILRKQVTLMGSWTFSITGQAECARFITERQVPVDQLFTDRWQLDQAVQAYKVFDQQSSGKGVFLM